MTIASADLHEAINTAWDASGLDAVFQSLWSVTVDATQFPVLHDQEASPQQPFPYVVMDQSKNKTTSRMSDVGALGRREIRDVTVRFNIHAQDVSGDARSAKEIAAYLMGKLMEVFGGHPTTAGTGTIVLTNGNHLITQYQNDWGVRTGDREYQWVVDYMFRLDVPVA